MERETRPIVIVVVVLLLVMLSLGVFIAAENSRMRAVLIDQTLLRLEEEYKKARAEEEANLRELRASLGEAFQRLSDLRGLSAQETLLVQTAMGLTDEILKAATSAGISLE